MIGAPRALARRYARALLVVALREGPDAALALRDELRAFVPLVSGHAELQRALNHPGLGAAERSASSLPWPSGPGRPTCCGG